MKKNPESARRIRLEALAAISVLFLAACGGGGGGETPGPVAGPDPSGFGSPSAAPQPVGGEPIPVPSGPDAPAPAPSPAPTPPPAPTPAPPPAPTPAPPSPPATSAFGSPVLNPTYASGTRSLTDRPDDFTGEQVKVIYAVPRDAADQQLDVTSKIPYSIAATNRWLEAQIGRKVRFDTFQGELDITFVQLPRTDAEYSASGLKFFDIVLDVSHLAAAGKNILVWYAGTGEPNVCGRANLGRPGLSGMYAIAYMTGCSSESTATSPDVPPTPFDYLVFHEVFHALGADHTPQFTQTPPADQYYQLACDLMYSPKGNLCLGGQYLDPFGRFYYNAAGVPGRTNTYDSGFLTPPRPVAP